MRRRCFVVSTLLFFSTVLLAQSSPVVKSSSAAPSPQSTPNGQPQAANVAPPLPMTAQLKKTIVFLEADCTHDFHNDALNLTAANLAQMPSVQQFSVLNQITAVLDHLRSVKASIAKLNAEEIARLFPATSAPSHVPANLPAEIEWKLNELIKMTTLSDQEIALLTQTEIEAIPL